MAPEQTESTQEEQERMLRSCEAIIKGALEAHNCILDPVIQLSGQGVSTTVRVVYVGKKETKE